MKGAVIYARYSCERQTEQSIEGQLHECYKYAEKNGLSILDEYIDRATTGTNDNRPAFQKMLADSERTTAWDIVLVYAIDRFGRNSIEIAINKQKLIKNGKNLISATQRTSTNIDGSKNLDGILLENMYIGLAEYYSAELSQKIRRGLTESRNKGLFCGGKVVYGYCVKDKTIYINEAETETVRYIFQEYNNGKTIPDIIEILDARGIKYKGETFKKNFLYRMLRNEKYIGITKYDGIEYKNIYPPIIKEDLFNAVQSRMVTYSVGAHSKDADLLLKGKVICGRCGHMMNGDCSTSRSGKLMHYYKCSGRKRGMGCESRILRQDKLDEFIIDVTKQVFCNKENIQLLVDKVIAVHKQRQKDESILNSLKNRHSDLIKSINNMLFALQEGIITPSTKERLNMLESDKAEIEEQIAKEELALSKQISREEVEYYLRRAIKSSPKILLNNLVDKVIVYDDKIEIYYKYCHKIPDDPDDQRGYFFEELRIPINCGKRNRQFLPITIDHQKMIASVKYILNRRKKMLAPINYKKRPILASQNVTGADGYLLVEIRGFEPLAFALRTRRSTN